MPVIDDDIKKNDCNIKYIFKYIIYLRLESKIIKLKILEIKYSLIEDGNIKHELLCKTVVGDDYYLLDMKYYQIAFTDDYKRLYRILYYNQGDLFDSTTYYNDSCVEVKKFLPIYDYERKLEEKYNNALKLQKKRKEEINNYNLY